MNAADVVALITANQATLVTVGMAVLGITIAIAVIKKTGSLIGR
jgi:hypothetical protein